MSLFKSLLNFLYPPRCPFCDRVLASDGLGDGVAMWKDGNPMELPICDRCVQELPWLKRSCIYCGHSLQGEEIKCLRCSGSSFSFEECCVLGRYEGKIRETLLRFKYRGQKSLAEPLGKLLYSKLALLSWASSIDFLVPVPLYPERFKLRGYNQASLLAGAVGKELGLPVIEALGRVRDTKSQTGLNKKQRAENLRGAFKCIEQIKKESHVLLIDDVLTSGSTAQEASLVLKKEGASRVSVAALAR
ncbi:MAG: ComF family protein [Bacillota bacterium]|nr:ComF family protein [Bacillota bacterium]